MQVLRKLVTAVAVLASVLVGMSSASASSYQQQHNQTRCNVPTSECSVYFGN
jgi:hypothetical protein